MILNNWHIGHRVTSYSVGVERTCPLCGRLFRKATPNQSDPLWWLIRALIVLRAALAWWRALPRAIENARAEVVG